jgi:flagellar basal-body rod protein FlgF
MSSGYYAAFSGLLARSEALDSAASNLSNSGTNGFRAEREFFRSAIMGPDALNSQLNRTVNDFGVLGGNMIDLGQGSLVPTGNPLDVAVEGQGFFAIQTAVGIRYTRDGQFQRTADGLLTTAHGDAVLNAANQPIRIPTGDATISSDGVVSVGGAAAATLGLWKFASADQLRPEGVDRYVAAPGSQPQAVAAALHQGSLEGSNQDVIQGTLQLVLVQRQAEMMQKALTVFDTDFNKPASEDLPKV